MAVYTSVDQSTLRALLDQYNIGKLINFEGILDGIENTNFKIITSKNAYILTIFEKRVSSQDLPFFVNLQNHLAKKGFLCPQPIPSQDGQYINKIHNKSCIIISFLEGKKTCHISENHCYQIGVLLSSLHLFSKDFVQSRTNKLNLSEWQKLFHKCQNISKHQYINIIKPIEEELNYLEKHWPSNLPTGIIHADVFQDNVFFKNNVFSGLIDFYFACNDYLSYEIAIAINDWCFNSSGEFFSDRFKSLIEGYQKNRSLTNTEKNSMRILLRGATMRILLTRLHDQLYHPAGAFVIPKDPLEYFTILQFHQNNSIYNN